MSNDQAFTGTCPMCGQEHLGPQLAAVTAELSEAQAREVKNLELFFKENSEKLRLIKERDEARATATTEAAFAIKVADENARLRAAIAPTPENAEALAEALYRKWYADDWTECKTSDPGYGRHVPTRRARLPHRHRRLRGGEAVRVSLHFLWFDFWIGAFYDRAKRTLYLCPLPMCVVKVQRAGVKL